jgi:hypothetical protein
MHSGLMERATAKVLAFGLHSLRAVFAFLAAGALMVGCSVLSPKQDRTQFIMLSPVKSRDLSAAQSATGRKLA